MWRLILVLVAVSWTSACATDKTAHDHGHGDHGAEEHKAHDHGSDDHGTDADASAASQHAAPMSFASAPTPGTKATCSVSKEAFVVEADTTIIVYQGRHYPMCCEKCEPEFKKDPAKYVTAK